MKVIDIYYQVIRKFETTIEGVRGKIGINNDELITRCPENEALCYQIILHKEIYLNQLPGKISLKTIKLSVKQLLMIY